MKKLAKLSITETLLSILPIAMIILILCIFLLPISTYDIVLFIISTIFLIIGVELFKKGAYRAMLPMGENIGSNLSKSRKLFYFIMASLLFGFIITLAEPDLLVLAGQVIGINKWAFIIAVAIGVSIFMMIAVMRIIFQIKITNILFISYSIILILMFFVPGNMLPISLDSGAVTSGPISVPFILALGAGISAVRASKDSKDDSFGLIALCSIGPIIVTMILSLFIDSGVAVTRTVIVDSTQQSFMNLFTDFGNSLLTNAYEIIIILAPIAIIFFIFNGVSLKLPKFRLSKIIVGLVYTYLGLILFLTGVFAGYLKIASIIGYQIALNYDYLLIPLSLLFGVVIILAEPSIFILGKKIEEITNGVIRKKIIITTICFGVAVSFLLAICRVIYDINILYIVAPCYGIVLILLFLTPKIFNAIAFDSGGVAAGSMSSGFILPFLIGTSEALGNNIMSSAFGVLTLVATVPIIFIQCLGVFYKIVSTKKVNKEKKYRMSNVKIVEFDVGEVS